ncbi:LysR family transcriptional regulator [Shewanella xiamenensis]|uniref:LysR family transcriptional regulator n=1 Tax=Shewanella xiamenensis TaxID=332186 RepID=A0ABT6U8C1_9GAMM|nr:MULTISPECIES: LysR family transcriptional regulator [Shewanella]PZP33129.1 MAG: LysR family transcriptional regulator [Shewanella oneidensis]MCT8861864.1 LysR family transcriptional regulator [Shewanella xiamenensis]MCT8866093.1 LysR family transcriptional regulator [Shewanella xiamenensis]MCT8870318.1 LysR family transcriptional regulator [Shewanella xiamenensis]MCT8874607.1 LysR family transcriptional regulator [Shewanella xiamenensis]
MPTQKPLDLNLLRVFMVVYRTRSFTQAAQELDLTQSSVSNAIGRLRSWVGESLFTRVGRGIEPTAVAREMYRKFEQPMADIETVLLGFEHFDPRSSQRRFYVYANESVIETLQAGVQALLLDADIEVIFRESPPQEAELYRDILLERVAVAIDIKPAQQTLLSSKLLFTESLVCIASKQHPRIHGAITHQQYFEEKHVFLNLRRFNLTAGDLFTEGVLPRRRMYSEQSSLLSMFATVGKSEAIGIAPLRYASQYAEMFGLQILPMPLKTRPIDLYMVWSSKYTQNPSHQWLRSLLLSASTMTTNEKALVQARSE